MQSPKRVNFEPKIFSYFRKQLQAKKKMKRRPEDFVVVIVVVVVVPFLF